MDDPLRSLLLAGNARAILRPLLLALLTALLVMLAVTVRRFNTGEVLAISLMVVATALALYFLERGRVTEATYALISAQLLAGTMGVVSYGSLRSVTNVLFIGAVVVAGIFVGRRGLITVVLITAATTGVLAFAEATGLLTSRPRPVGWVHWLALCLTVSLIAIAVHFSRTVAFEARERLETELAERVRAETASRLAEERLRLSMAVARQGWFDLDILSGRVVASEEFSTLIGAGKSSAGMTVQSWMDSIHDDDRPAVLAMFQEVLIGDEARQMEYRLRARTGEWKWVRSIARVVERDARGRPLRMTGTHADISEQMKATEAQRESDLRYRTLFEQAGDYLLVLEVVPDGPPLIRDVNLAALQAFGYERSELIGQPVSILEVPVAAQSHESRARQVRALGSAIFELRHRRKDGSEFDAEVRASEFTWGGKRLSIATERDVSERKRTEAALRIGEERYRSTFELAVNGILQSTFDGRAIAANPSFVRMFGYASEEEVVATLNDLPHGLWAEPSEREEVVRLILTQGDVRGYETEFLRKDGSRIWVSLNAAVALAPDGHRSHFHTSIDDISARKRAEAESANLQAQLLQAQKMESVGRLAGGVAHDFNNMLGVIIGVAELAMQPLEDRHPLRADLQEIHDAARRSADLTRQLLTFARKQTVARRPLDLNETVSRTTRMLARLIGENVHLEWQPGADLWRVYMDATQVDQILANLSVNAKDAIADVGTLRIATENRTVDAAFAASHADAVPGEYVCLTVSDSGRGMTNEIAAQIFEPFFTTKGVGEGTGLGLSTVYGAVRQNQGFITVSSVVGRGTTFEIYLPRHMGTGEHAIFHPEAATVRGPETILVVEDEPRLLQLTTRALERSGYVVLTAHTPAKAIEVEAAYEGEIDLLLSDVVMPKMNGRTLADAIRVRRPRIKWLFMSGFTTDVTGVNGMLEDAERFIGKPFSIAALNAKVREVLDG